MLRTAALCLSATWLWLAAAAAEPVPFRNGTSLQVFTFPATTDGGYAPDPYPDAPDMARDYGIARLRAMGLDHVRLPVDVGPLLDDPDGGRWSAIVPRLRTAIRELHGAGLAVIVTLVAPGLNGRIPEDQLDGIDGGNFRRYAALAGRIAAEFEGIGTGPLALEPMNEPQQACMREDTTDWIAYQDILIGAMRRHAPELWLGLTGGCWSQIEGLAALRTEQLGDPRTFVSVHFYEPFLFTHQGADWALDIMPLIGGLPYPADAGKLEAVLTNARRRAAALDMPDTGRQRLLTSAEASIRHYFAEAHGPATLRARLDMLDAWRRRHGIAPERIVFTEFGAMKTPEASDDTSRARWLRDVSGILEERGWGWTLWVLRGGPFGLDVEGGDYNPDLIGALRLKNP